MIKFTATINDKRKLLGLGLTHTNLDRLRDNQSINIKGKSVGLDNLEILIFAGETEESIADQLAQYITAETIVHSFDEFDEDLSDG